MIINWRTHKRIVLSIGFLALLALVFLWRVAFRGDILLALDMLLTYEPWRSELPGATAFPLWNERTSDTVRQVYPIFSFVRESWRRGEIASWYPYNGIGMPIRSALVFQIFYPVNNFLWQVMPLSYGLGWSTILHLFLGSVFIYLFLAELGVNLFGRLVAAISFTYSSSLVMYLSSPQMFDAMIWIPLIFWGLERAMNRHDWRWSLVAVAGLFMHILAGQIQLVLYTCTAFLLYAGCRTLILWKLDGSRGLRVFLPVGYTVFVLTAGIGIAAFLLLPVIELASTLHRGEGSIDLQNPPLALLRIFIPDLFGTFTDGLTMTSGHRGDTYLYLGLLPLFFAFAALFSPRRWLAGSLVGIGLLFLLVIFNVTPFYQLFYYLYPTFRALGLARIMFIIVFFWATAAGIGADWLVSERPQQTLKTLIWVGSGLGLFALVYLAGLAFIAKYQARQFWHLPDVPAFLPSTLYHYSTVVFFLILLGSILLLLRAWANNRISAQLFSILSIVLIVADLFLTHIDYIPALPKHMLFPVTPSLKFLLDKTAQESQPFRISGVDKTLWPNTSGVFNLSSVQVYDSFLSRRYAEYAEASGVRAPSTFRIVTFKAEASRLLDALNVKYLYTPRNLLAAGDGVSLLTEVESPQIVSDFVEAGQIYEWSIENWPQNVLLAPAPTAIQYQGVLPGNMRLETAIAIDPQFWEADGVTFEIYATSPGQDAKEPIFSQSLHPRENPTDRQWVPIQVNLSEFSNQPVVLSLVTQPAGQPGTRGGWADPMLVDADQWELLYYGPNSIYRNKRVLPRAWLVHRVTKVSPDNIEAAKAVLAQPGFDPAVEAVVEGDLPEFMPAKIQDDSNQGGVNITHYEPSRIEITATTSQPGLLVLSDLYYPGWQAYVDHQPQPVLATNLAMRGVYLEPGEHTIIFSYQPQSFRWGLYISLAALGGIIIALVINWQISRS